MPRVRLLASAFLVVALVLADLAGAARGRTLFVTRDEVVAFAFDAGRVAWADAECFRVRARTISTGETSTLGTASTSECQISGSVLAFGGGRALWTAVSSGNNVYADVVTGAPGERPAALEQVVDSSAGPSGEYLTDVAGDGSVLVYGVVSLGMLDTCIDPGSPCDHFVSDGRVMRVVGRRAVRIPGAPPPLRLAAGGGRVAVEVARDSDGQRVLSAGPIEVRDAISGRLSATVRPRGAVVELGLSRQALAVLVRSGGRKLIERYDAATGRLLGRTPVYGNARSLATSGRRIVFVTGRTIRLLDALTGGGRIVAIADSRPLEVAIDGRRIVWVDRASRFDRFVAMNLE